MVGMTLVGNIGIRGEDDIGSEYSHAGGDGFAQVSFGIETAVLHFQEVHIVHAEHCRTFQGLLPADFDKILGSGALRGIGKSVAAVEADEKAHALSERDQLGNGGAGTDFDVIGMRAYEEIAGKTLQLGKRGGCFQDQSEKAHLTDALLSSSSEQILSYSGSSSLYLAL